MPATAKKAAKKQPTAKKPTASKLFVNHYDDYKTYKGQQYTGMQVGRSHKWYYDKGEWHDRKVTPDKWEITYSVTKRRAGKAPEGSGVPVGTGYHWFILAHQFVHKLNADDYTTTMVGLKLKLAHKRANKNKWNVTDSTARKHLIEGLQQFIKQLKDNPRSFEYVPLDFEFQKKKYSGFAVPMMASCNGSCHDLDVTLNDKHIGILRSTTKGWRMTNVKPQGFVNMIGAAVDAWYA